MLTYYQLQHGKVHAELKHLALCDTNLLTYPEKATRADFAANPCQHCLRKLRALADEIHEVTHEL